MAWRELPQDDADALRGFIREYPSSPLSERAFTRLQELGEADSVLPPTAQRGLESSADTHQALLVRPTGLVAVATLDLSPVELQAQSTTPTWSPRLELGLGSNLAGSGQLGLTLGTGVQRGWLGGVTRFRLSPDQSTWQAGLHLERPGPQSWAPYSELLGARRMGDPLLTPWAVGGAAGVVHRWRPEISAQLGAEAWSGGLLGLQASLRYSF